MVSRESEMRPGQGDTVGRLIIVLSVEHTGRREEFRARQIDRPGK